jgi:hypothetical protein
MVIYFGYFRKHCCFSAQLIFGAGRDSSGSSGTGETPEALKTRKEAQRPPHGKRVPAAKINILRDI